LFQAKDYFPVQVGDTLQEDPKSGEFVKDFWGRGERESFVKVHKNGMAGRAGKGRGRGGRGEEMSSWGEDPSLWNPGFGPQNFPPQQFEPASVSIPRTPLPWEPDGASISRCASATRASLATICSQTKVEQCSGAKTEGCTEQAEARG
jgi:hypothetical protein